MKYHKKGGVHVNVNKSKQTNKSEMGHGGVACAEKKYLVAVGLAAGTGAGVAASSGLDVSGLTSLGGLLGLSLRLLGGLDLGSGRSTLNLGLGDLDIDLTTTQLGLVVGESSLLGLGEGIVGNETVSAGASAVGNDVGLQASSS